MKKLILPLIAASVLTTLSAHAASFSGRITAVQRSNGSITVRSGSGKVKMFQVSKPGQYRVGQSVSVSYSPQYKWPLPSDSVSVK